eukprot:3431972-Prymnesium_polylepis.1
MPICGRERVPLSSGGSQEAGAGAYDPSQGVGGATPGWPRSTDGSAMSTDQHATHNSSRVRPHR